MGLYISGGSGRTVAVNSAEQIQTELDNFAKLVQEAILIDGRNYALHLTFSAQELSPDDDPNPFSEPF